MDGLPENLSILASDQEKNSTQNQYVINSRSPLIYHPDNTSSQNDTVLIKSDSSNEPPKDPCNSNYVKDPIHDNAITPPIFDLKAYNFDQLWFKNDDIEDWMYHISCEWLYNSKNNLYYHIQTKSLYVQNPSKPDSVSGTEEHDQVNKFFVISNDGGTDDNTQNASSIPNSSCENFPPGDTILNDDDDENIDEKVEFIKHNKIEIQSIPDPDHHQIHNRTGTVVDNITSDSFISTTNTDFPQFADIPNDKDNQSKSHGGNNSLPNSTNLDNSIFNPSVGESNEDYTEGNINLNEFLLNIEKQMEMNKHNSSSENGNHLDNTDNASDVEFEMDLANDLKAGTSVIMGSLKCKSGCEDRYITQIPLRIDSVTKTDSLCFYSAIFDGHAGSTCADYVSKNLHKNILSVFRQSIETIRKKREHSRNKNLTSRNKKMRRNTSHSVEVESLITACEKAFEITDKNYIDYAMRNKLHDGCTGCVVLLYGPDEDGTLKIICANAGDSRAVLCRDDHAVRLTEDHRPNRPDERKRIERAGGTVLNINGVWRVLNIDKDTNKAFGLSTSRSFGDILLKHPKKLVSSVPEIQVYNVDFDKDLFVVLGSDGIFDVLSDQNVVDIGISNLNCSPEKAAQLIVESAKELGSHDDKTTTVIFFLWRKDRFKSIINEFGIPNKNKIGFNKNSSISVDVVKDPCEISNESYQIVQNNEDINRKIIEDIFEADYKKDDEGESEEITEFVDTNTKIGKRRKLIQ